MNVLSTHPQLRMENPLSQISQVAWRPSLTNSIWKLNAHDLVKEGVAVSAHPHEVAGLAFAWIAPVEHMMSLQRTDQVAS